MKILVYGAGVIGSYLTHVLCAAGNEVALLAQGAWRGTLEGNGLTVFHYLQKKVTCDHPRMIGAVDDRRYDLVFVVMQYQQMMAILADLAGADRSIVVLVGNNISAQEMEAYIKAHTVTCKTVFFRVPGNRGTKSGGSSRLRLVRRHGHDGRRTAR